MLIKIFSVSDDPWWLDESVSSDITTWKYICADQEITVR